MDPRETPLWVKSRRRYYLAAKSIPWYTHPLGRQFAPPTTTRYMEPPTPTQARRKVESSDAVPYIDNVCAPRAFPDHIGRFVIQSGTTTVIYSSDPGPVKCRNTHRLLALPAVET